MYFFLIRYRLCQYNHSVPPKLRVQHHPYMGLLLPLLILLVRLTMVTWFQRLELATVQAGSSERNECNSQPINGAVLYRLGCQQRSECFIGCCQQHGERFIGQRNEYHHPKSRCLWSCDRVLGVSVSVSFPTSPLGLYLGAIHFKVPLAASNVDKSPLYKPLSHHLYTDESHLIICLQHFCLKCIVPMN